jgi:hypothetical protein
MADDKKEITISNNKERYKTAQESDQKIDKLQRIASISFLYLGAELKRQKEEKLYEYLGESPEYESFEAYVRSKNIELRKAYYLMQIHTTFVEQLKFQPEELAGIHWTSLRVLLPIVKKENAQELIDKAKLLTRGHIETEMRQLKTGLHSLKDIQDCPHSHVRRVVFYECDVCKERFKYLPDGSEVIK